MINYLKNINHIFNIQPKKIIKKYIFVNYIFIHIYIYIYIFLIFNIYL